MAAGQKEEAVASSEPTASSEPSIPYTIFTSRQKLLIVTIVSVASTFSGFASNIYFPAIPAIALDLSVTPELGMFPPLKFPFHLGIYELLRARDSFRLFICAALLQLRRIEFDIDIL